jgi:hypothetical protein
MSGRAPGVPRKSVLFIDTLRQLGRLPKLKFVVFGGDQIHYGPNDKESLDVFRNGPHLNMPSTSCSGNTEVSPVNSVSISAGRISQSMGSKGSSRSQSSWAFDPVKGVRVIGFDVTADGKPHGEASPTGLKWLEKELQGNRDKKLIMVFTHQLLRPTTPQDKMPGWSLWMVKNSLKVNDILERHQNVRLVVSGHHHVSKVETVGRITYVSDPAIVTYPCAFAPLPSRGTAFPCRISVSTMHCHGEPAKRLLISDPFAGWYDPQRRRMAVYQWIELARPANHDKAVTQLLMVMRNPSFKKRRVFLCGQGG